MPFAGTRGRGVLLCLLLALGSGGCALDQDAPAPAPPSASAPPPAWATGTGQVRSLIPAQADVDGPGQMPQVVDGRLRTGADSGGLHLDVLSRSEIVWGVPAPSRATARQTQGRPDRATQTQTSQTQPHELRLREGDRLSVSFDLTPDLGDSSQNRFNWTVLWQLLGPRGDEWPPPPLTLHVSRGTWKIGGGAGYPDGSREAYTAEYLPYVDKQTVSWRLDVVISQDPQVAKVDVYRDGHKAVSGWSPPGGTLYPGQGWVLMKTGLYSGGPSTGQSRSVDLTRLDLTLGRGDDVTRYRYEQTS